MALDHLLPSMQPQSFLEWTSTSFEQSLAEFYTILIEEHLQVALEMLEVRILFLTLVSNSDHSSSMIFKSGFFVGLGKC
jgi:hypothetical protein